MQFNTKAKVRFDNQRFTVHVGINGPQAAFASENWKQIVKIVKPIMDIYGDIDQSKIALSAAIAAAITRGAMARDRFTDRDGITHTISRCQTTVAVFIEEKQV